MAADQLLHPDYLQGAPFFGRPAADILSTHAAQADASALSLESPVTVLIRTKNDAASIEGLLDDIDQQAFNGEVEVLAVDTESNDGTYAILKAYGATIVSIAQEEFNYPLSLNRGIEAAAHENIFMTVGHANFSNKQTVRAVARALDADAAGVYGPVLPGGNASFWERKLALTVRPHLSKTARAEKYVGGMYGATNAAISKTAWEEIGGFDERFAAGGEDGAMAKKMIEQGYDLARDPLLAVHHSHGLGVIDSLKQLKHWQEIGKPLPFDADALAARRPDMRAKLAQDPTDRH